MPSLLDHLASGDEDDLTAPDPPPGIIDAVKADGSRRRANRRRRNLGVAAVLALAVLAVPTAVLRSGDGGAHPEFHVAAGGDSTITTEVIEPVEPGEPTAATDPTLPAPAWLPPPPPPGIPPPGVPPSVTTPPPTAPPATTAQASAGSGTGPVTTAAAPACRNSDNPACGPFRWDPEPSPNQPLVAQFVSAPSQPVAVGQKVDFEVHWSDPDADLTYQYVAIDGGMAQACDYVPRYGPWTPPAKVAGTGRLPFSHTFEQPGTFKLVVSLGTSNCSSPYGSDLAIEATVTVEPVVEVG